MTTNNEPTPEEPTAFGVFHHQLPEDVFARHVHRLRVELLDDEPSIDALDDACADFLADLGYTLRLDHPTA